MFRIASAAFLALSLLACTPSAELPKGTRLEDLLAQVGPRFLTKADFQDAAKQRTSLFRSPVLNDQRRKELLFDLVSLELMALEAERQGLHRSPSVERAQRRAAIQLLLRRTLPSWDVKFDASQTPLQTAAMGEKAKTHYDAWLRSLRAKTAIEINKKLLSQIKPNPSVPSLPRDLPQTRPSSPSLSPPQRPPLPQPPLPQPPSLPSSAPAPRLQRSPASLPASKP